MIYYLEDISVGLFMAQCLTMIIVWIAVGMNEISFLCPVLMSTHSITSKLTRIITLICTNLNAIPIDDITSNLIIYSLIISGSLILLSRTSDHW